MSKARTMSMRGDNFTMQTTFTGSGPTFDLVVEDFGDDGMGVSRRVRVPLYGTNVRCILDELRKWKKVMLEEAGAVP